MLSMNASSLYRGELDDRASMRKRKSSDSNILKHTVDSDKDAVLTSSHVDLDVDEIDFDGRDEITRQR